MYKNNTPSGISVIICTCNRSKRLIYALEALGKQNIPDGLHCEILVVNNGSTDDTFKVADDFGKTLKGNVHLRIIYEPQLGKANALMKGYDEAKYELMLVCDDDNWLQPDYLKTVIEIFHEHPETGLLGGYGIVEFRGEEKPPWFDKWQQFYACGKHHEKSGFLNSGDYTIWGAGSVIRKTLWQFLRKNGFHFINTTGPDKHHGEDVELSHAVMYSGSKLYFDERLWYYHDYSGGRITKEKLKKHVKISCASLFPVYAIAYKNSPDRKNKFNSSFFRMIISLTINLIIQSLKKNNEPVRRYLFIQYRELLAHRKKYKLIYDEIFPWISKVKEAYPLKGTTL